MPSIFKALASISAWVLFLWGVGTIASTTVAYYLDIGIGNQPTTAIFMGWGLGSVQFILAVCAMKLRHMME